MTVVLVVLLGTVGATTGVRDDSYVALGIIHRCAVVPLTDVAPAATATATLSGCWQRVHSTARHRSCSGAQTRTSRASRAHHSARPCRRSSRPSPKTRPWSGRIGAPTNGLYPGWRRRAVPFDRICALHDQRDTGTDRDQLRPAMSRTSAVRALAPTRGADGPIPRICPTAPARGLHGCVRRTAPSRGDQLRLRVRCGRCEGDGTWSSGLLAASYRHHGARRTWVRQDGSRRVGAACIRSLPGSRAGGRSSGPAPRALGSPAETDRPTRRCQNRLHRDTHPRRAARKSGPALAAGFVRGTGRVSRDGHGRTGPGLMLLPT